ncbi:MAG: hypothetical protein A3I75_01725 [Deltaproteobacteria bacterium RIFCSPLOWO2_02_FULL_50_16]|nr:MAG: hypothetical protein A2053_06100 [Deltaproteobacteria bacterium GWA2_50_8]OGQ27033.1 MAG: hypothetical protein A3B79_07360 [Deltaproteobacteria bacterium RIFCSPHIGHO2_02_FULL_50_15]OGQ56256.1 MAG: hypothetical protein A3I75_01725 [Deltaproteobacteria bacterium RIFCSPLOWO2_02_FULL_50_16]OGQ68155.1 MAG: hypothetical protein A3F89_00290 [Deltaproteobacteria bacterium RIFCSPLOWO2_12_FULL_50_11]
MAEYYLAITTLPNLAEAKKLARELVEKKVVACVNILPGATSLYWWEGKIQEDAECVLLMKTHEKSIERLKKTLPELHSYSCPELVCLPIFEGHPPYLKWLEDSVTD